MNKKATIIVVRTPGEMSYLHRIRDFVTGIAAESGISQHDIDNIELAVDEACANVIEHGYDPDAPSKDLTIRMEINASKLVLTIIDQGKSFDPRNNKPLALEDLIAMGRNGGLGIRLILEIMDEVDYQTTADGHNELILTKYFNPVESHQNQP